MLHRDVDRMNLDVSLFETYVSKSLPHKKQRRNLFGYSIALYIPGTCKDVPDSLLRKPTLHHFLVGVLHGAVQNGDERLRTAELLDGAFQQVRSER